MPQQLWSIFGYLFRFCRRWSGNIHIINLFWIILNDIITTDHLLFFHCCFNVHFQNSIRKSNHPIIWPQFYHFFIICFLAQEFIFNALVFTSQFIISFILFITLLRRNQNDDGFPFEPGFAGKLTSAVSGLIHNNNCIQGNKNIFFISLLTDIWLDKFDVIFGGSLVFLQIIC